MAAAAIVGSAVIGAAASSSAASKSAKASKNAAAASQASTDAEIQLQREARDAAEKELRPYVTEGDSARRMYNSAYGVAPSDGTSLESARSDYNAGFEASPYWQDAQYSTAEAINAMKSSNAAAGKGGEINSGKALRAASDITQSYRSGATQNYLAGLGGIADTGYSASSGIASGGQTYANNASSALRSGTAATNAANQSAATASASGASDTASWAGWAAGQLANSGGSSYFSPGASLRATSLTPYTTGNYNASFSSNYNF